MKGLRGYPGLNVQKGLVRYCEGCNGIMASTEVRVCGIGSSSILLGSSHIVRVKLSCESQAVLLGSSCTVRVELYC